MKKILFLLAIMATIVVFSRCGRSPQEIYRDGEALSANSRFGKLTLFISREPYKTMVLEKDGKQIFYYHENQIDWDAKDKIFQGREGLSSIWQIDSQVVIIRFLNVSAHYGNDSKYHERAKYFL